MGHRNHRKGVPGFWSHKMVALSIWSIRRHQSLLSVLRRIMWSFSAVVLLAALVGRLDLQTALGVIGFGGLAVVVLLTGLVLTRRNVLLSVKDPELKAEARQAMLELIRSKTSSRATGRQPSRRAGRSGAGRCPQTGECAR